MQDRLRSRLHDIPNITSQAGTPVREAVTDASEPSRGCDEPRGRCTIRHGMAENQDFLEVNLSGLLKDRQTYQYTAQCPAKPGAYTDDLMYISCRIDVADGYVLSLMRTRIITIGCAASAQKRNIDEIKYEKYSK